MPSSLFNIFGLYWFSSWWPAVAHGQYHVVVILRLQVLAVRKGIWCGKKQTNQKKKH